MNEFFAGLARRWSQVASKRGAAIEPPDLDPAVADEILQLARVVAHGKERSFAPLASFMAGVATERFRSAQRSDADASAAIIRDVRESLEREIGKSDG